MRKRFYKKDHQQANHSEEKLAAACNVLRDLSDDEFESWVERDDVSPSKYEKAANEFLSQPISEKIADLKRKAAINPDQRFAPAEWLQNIMTEIPWLSQAIWVKIVSFAEIEDESDVEFAPALSATSSKPRRGKSVRLPAVLRQRLPWVGEKLRIKSKQSQEDSQKNVFLVSLEVRRHAAKTGGLGVAIKFKSNEQPVVVFLKPNESSKPIGTWPDELQDLEIQLFLPERD